LIIVRLYADDSFFWARFEHERPDARPQAFWDPMRRKACVGEFFALNRLPSRTRNTHLNPSSAPPIRAAKTRREAAGGSAPSLETVNVPVLSLFNLWQVFDVSGQVSSSKKENPRFLPTACGHRSCKPSAELCEGHPPAGPPADPGPGENGFLRQGCFLQGYFNYTPVATTFGPLACHFRPSFPSTRTLAATRAPGDAIHKERQRPWQQNYAKLAKGKCGFPETGYPPSMGLKNGLRPFTHPMLGAVMRKAAPVTVSVFAWGCCQQ